MKSKFNYARKTGVKDYVAVEYVPDGNKKIPPPLHACYNHSPLMSLDPSMKNKKGETRVENSINESKSYLDTMLDYFAHPVDDGVSIFTTSSKKF